MRGKVRNFGLLRCLKNIQGEMRGSWVNKCEVEGSKVGRRDISEHHQLVDSRVHRGALTAGLSWETAPMLRGEEEKGATGRGLE